MKLLLENDALKHKIYELPFNEVEKKELLLKAGLFEEQILYIIDSIFLIIEDDFVYTSEQTQIYYEGYIERGGITALRKNNNGIIIFQTIRIASNKINKNIKELHEQTKQKHNRLKILKYL